MRRVLAYLIIALASLLILAAVVVQAVLWSDVPRRMVTDALADQLGLSVRIDDVSTGWLGRTRLRGVRLSLPLADRPIVEADAIEVEHAALLWLVVTGDLALDRLEVVRPRVAVRQAESGRWNIEQLAAVLADRLTGGEDQAGAGGPPRLPTVVIRDAAMAVTRWDEPTMTIAPVQVRGDAASRQRYDVVVESPVLGKVMAKVAVGGPWAHEVRFDVSPDAALLTAMGVVGSAAGSGSGASAPPVVIVSGTYGGELADGSATGTLDLDRASIGSRWIAGRAQVRVDADAGEVTALPRTLALHGVGPSPVRIHDGEAVYVLGGRLRLKGVALTGWGMDAVVTGEGDPLVPTGEVTVAWRGDAERDEVDHRGEATLTLAQGVTGWRRVHLAVKATARTAWADAAVTATGRAYGRTWDAMRGRVTLDRLEAERGGERLTLSGLTARVGVADGRVYVDSVQLPPSQRPRQVAAEGSYQLGEGEWALEAAAAALALPGMTVDRVTLKAAGQPDGLSLHSLRLRGEGIEVAATGGYFYNKPQPLALSVTLEQLPIQVGDAGATSVMAENLGGVLAVRGKLSPMDVHAEGELTARSLRIGDRRVGDVALRVEGTADPTGAQVTATAPKWLGGRWRAEGVWHRAADEARVDVTGGQLDLAAVEQLLDTPVTLQGTAGLALTIRTSQADPAGFDASGTFHVEQVAAGTPWAHTQAQRVAGRVQVDRHTLRLTDVRMQRDASTIDAEATVDLADGGVDATARFDGWPIEVSSADIAVEVTGDGRMRYGGVDADVTGAAQLEAQVRGPDVDLARITLDAGVAPGRLALRSLTGEVLGGTVAGEGVIDWADLVQSDVAVEWDGVEPAMLGAWWSPAMQWRGRVSGAVTAREAMDPRAIGPLKIEVRLDAGDATVSGLPLGDGFATAYADGTRFVLEDLSQQALGGQWSLWGRVSRHDGAWFAYASAAAKGVDLAAVTTALTPQRHVLGRMDAELTVSTPLDDWSAAFGRGRLAVHESDLAEIPLATALFRLVNLRITDAQPDGRGRGDLRIEGGRVMLNSFRYQNRGTQITLAPLRIDDVWAGGGSTISGFATLTQSLLPEVEFFGSVNEALAILQSDLVAARITGTLGEPIVQERVLGGVTDELTQIITGGAAADDALHDAEADAP